MRILVLCILILGSLASLGAPPNKAIISARQLILKKNRVDALEILTTALAKDIHKPKIRNEIIKEISSLAKVFFTEEGQKNFELAESMLYVGKAGATEKYEEALALEDSNSEVLLGLARARLSEGNCSAAKAAILKLEKINPFSPEKKILKLKTDICLKQTSLVIENDPAFKDEFKINYKLLQAEVFLSQAKIKEASDVLNEITDEKMPELAYWRFKANEMQPLQAAQHAEKYLDLCKGLTPALRREYKLEPLLCQRTEEVETFLKKNEMSK